MTEAPRGPTGPRGPREVDRVDDMREVLTATGAGAYLATHTAGPLPAETMSAVRESDDLELRIGRAGPDRPEDLEQRDKEARAVAAAAIHAAPEHVALVNGAADGVRLILLDLVSLYRSNGRDRVVVLGQISLDVAVAIDGVAAASGLRVDRATTAEDLEGDVLVIVVAHVDGTGALTDVAHVATAARAVGAVVLVDGSLSVGAVPFDVTDDVADAVVADGHRWLLGPEGTGMAWVAPGLDHEAAARLRRASSTLGRGRLLGLARSVGWLLMYMELPWVVRRTVELADRLYGGLGGIAGVSLAADADHGALASFAIDGWTPAEAIDELSRGVFAIVDADEDAGLVRASVGAWNREDEVDRFVGQVAEIAAHTPDTFPRKLSLTVISGPVEEDA